MSEHVTLTKPFRTMSSSRRKATIVAKEEQSRVPRISRLMALAIYLQQMIDEGIVADQAEIARLGHVSRARVTQIMNLLNLAPEIQEEILHLSAAERGREPMTERSIRSIAAVVEWQLQTRRWKQLSRN